jgi:hypothetical protein
MATAFGPRLTPAPVSRVLDGTEMGITLPVAKHVTHASQFVPAPSRKPEDIERAHKIEDTHPKRISHLFCRRAQKPAFFLNLVKSNKLHKFFIRKKDPTYYITELFPLAQRLRLCQRKSLFSP